MTEETFRGKFSFRADCQDFIGRVELRASEESEILWSLLRYGKKEVR